MVCSDSATLPYLFFSIPLLCLYTQYSAGGSHRPRVQHNDGFGVHLILCRLSLVAPMSAIYPNDCLRLTVKCTPFFYCTCGLLQ